MSASDYIFLSIIIVSIISTTAIIVINLKVKKIRKEANNPKEVQFVLIGGGSGSGKSYISKKIIEKFKKNKKGISLLRMDFYYKTIEEEKIENINFDVPEIIDWERLKSDIEKLKNRENIKEQNYNFETGKYSSNEGLIIKANDFVILEGIFALFNETINNMAIKKIFINATEEKRRERRLNRDLKERYPSKTKEELIKVWNEKVAPMHEKYVEQTKKNADYIIENTDESDKKNLEEKIDWIYNSLNN